MATGYFAHDEDRDKLVFLYFLRVTNLELPKESLLNEIAAVYTQSDYFSLSLALKWLTDNGHVAKLRSTGGVNFCITDQGRNAVEEFVELIPQSLREDIRFYTADSRQRMAEQSQHLASIVSTTATGVLVNLKIVENEMTLMDLTLNVPTSATATTICNKFTRKAPELYRAIFDVLFNEDEL